MNSWRSVSYLDGNVFMRVNNLLHGSTATVMDIHILSSFVEAVVLSDYIVRAFNQIDIQNMKYVQKHFIDNNILHDLKPEIVNPYRITMRGNSAFAYYVRDDLAKTILSFDMPDALVNDSAAEIIKLRDAMFAKMRTYDNFVKYIPEEIEDLIKIARSFEMDFVTCPEWLPFVYPNETTTSISFRLYNEIAKLHKLKIENLIEISRPKAIYIPPLLSIVLQRCKSRENFLDVLLDVRQEYTSYRDSANIMQDQMSCSETIGEQLRILAEYESSIKALANKIDRPKPRLLQIVWNAFKKTTPNGIVTEALDNLYQCDIERQRLNRVEGFFDIWSSAMNVESYFNQIERVFGSLNEGNNKLLLRTLQKLEQLVNPRRM